MDVNEAALQLVREHSDEVLILLDAKGTEPARREALLNLLAAAYKWGIRDGVPRGGHLMADEIIRRIGAQA